MRRWPRLARILGGYMSPTQRKLRTFTLISMVAGLGQ